MRRRIREANKYQKMMLKRRRKSYENCHYQKRSIEIERKWDEISDYNDCGRSEEVVVVVVVG